MTLTLGTNYAVIANPLRLPEPAEVLVDNPDEPADVARAIAQAMLPHGCGVTSVVPAVSEVDRDGKLISRSYWCQLDGELPDIGGHAARELTNRVWVKVNA